MLSSQFLSNLLLTTSLLLSRSLTLSPYLLNLPALWRLAENMPPKPLVQLCTQVCIKHITMIADLGDIPYSRARPILLRVDDAAQLHELEVNSPHLVADTPEIWKRLIARHFTQWQKKNYVPKNPSSWHKVYARYKREHDAELAEAEARLKSAFATLESEKEARKSKIVEQRLLPRPPKDGRGVGGRRAGAAGADLPSHLSFGGGSRTRLTDGQSFLKKARREAREDANRRTLSTPTGQLAVRPGQIAKAPEAMVLEHRIKQQPPIRINAPRSRSTASAEDPARKERELRLLKLKGPPSSRVPQVLSDSEDDGYDEPADLDDLFGDEDEAESRPSPAKKVAVAAAASPSSSVPREQSNPLRKGRNAGLLSNAYRSGPQKRIAHSPPRSLPHGSSSPPLRPQQTPSRSTQPASNRTGAPLPSKTHPSEAQRRTATSPPDATIDPVPQTSQSNHPVPPSPQQGQPSTSAPAASSSSMLRKRKPAVDIFMRPKKIPR